MCTPPYLVVLLCPCCNTKQKATAWARGRPGEAAGSLLDGSRCINIRIGQQHPDTGCAAAGLPPVHSALPTCDGAFEHQELSHSLQRLPVGLQPPAGLGFSPFHQLQWEQ